jgi:uncharacterized protein
MGLLLQRKRGLGQTALITGASGRIGEALAGVFASGGFDLILVARSKDALEALAQGLSGKHKVSAEIIVHDLGVPGAGASLVEKLGARADKIDILINNAGFGLIGDFADQDEQRILGMIDLNVRVLTELCRAFLPRLKGRKKGGIINIASTASYQPGPYMAVYYATKAYVRSLSEALNEEMRGTAVHVMSVCPGPVTTGFQSAAHMPDTIGLLKLVPAMSAKRVAQETYRAFFARRRTYIPGWINWLMAMSASVTPTGIMLRMVRSLQT